MSALRMHARSAERTTAFQEVPTVRLDPWTKTALMAIGGVAVFSSMDVGDELWSRWDIGESQVTSGFIAGLVNGTGPIPTLLAFAGIMLGRRWGFGLGILVGLMGLWPPLTHVTDTDGMTAYRSSIEVLAAVSAVVLIAVAVKKLMTSSTRTSRS